MDKVRNSPSKSLTTASLSPSQVFKCAYSSTGPFLFRKSGCLVRFSFLNKMSVTHHISLAPRLVIC